MKRVFPFIVVAGACAWSYWGKRHLPNSLEIGVITAVIGTVIMVVVLKRGLWRMADIVEDHGDRLKVSRWRTNIEIPLPQVTGVRRTRRLTGSEVTLVLSTPSALGLEVSFLAPDERRVPGIEKTLDELSQRAVAQRRNAAV